MNAIKRSKSGFTMVELLVVLVIVGILAAVATPIFLGNTKKAKASEAVATMSLIRQAQRDYFINNNNYITAASDISKTLPNGFNIDTGMTQYFGNDAFKVVQASSGESKAPFTQDDGSGNSPTAPAAQDFVIIASGVSSNGCASTATAADNCALKETEVKDFLLEMDNSGRTYVSYDGGTNWQKY